MHRTSNAELTGPSIRPQVLGPIIDVDQHLNETFGTWDSVDLTETGGLKLDLREDELGRRFLYLGEERIGPGRATVPDEYERIARLIAADELAYEREKEDRALNPRSFDETCEPTASDPAARIPLLDQMATDVAIMFPSYAFYWTRLVEPRGHRVVQAHMAAWNDWVAGQCAPYRKRLLAAGQIGLYDVDWTVAEIHRCAALGMKGVSLAMKPFRGVPWSHPSNEPVWEALEETGLAVFMHIAVMPHTVDPAWERVDAYTDSHSGPDLSSMINRHLPVEAALSDLIFGGVFERHPGLKVATMECGGLWVRSFLERIDWVMDVVGVRNHYLRRQLSMPPSDYFRRAVRVGAFPFEGLPDYLFEGGEDLFLYASDFPHYEGTAYGTRRFEEVFDALGTNLSIRQKFYVDNSAEFFGISPVSGQEGTPADVVASA
ncbi:amidohydrolase family protein [Streptosporangium amethystogenes]|uniref:amidohydrolase family protein n=1 Tax=Streptosporangium amethystogenes TaxID=2002 RepID=UPI0037BA0DCC